MIAEMLNYSLAQGLEIVTKNAPFCFYCTLTGNTLLRLRVKATSSTNL